MQQAVTIHAVQRLNKTASIHLHLLWPLFGHLHPLHVHMQDGHVATDQAPPTVCLPAAPVQSVPASPAPFQGWMLLAVAALAGIICGMALTCSARTMRTGAAATPTASRQVRAADQARCVYLSVCRTPAYRLSEPRHKHQAQPVVSAASSPVDAAQTQQPPAVTGFLGLPGDSHTAGHVAQEHVGPRHGGAARAGAADRGVICECVTDSTLAHLLASPAQIVPPSHTCNVHALNSRIRNAQHVNNK